MTLPYRKKLIEVALPLEAINKAFAREKGNPFLTLGEVDGEPMVVSGGTDDTVQLWDGRTGRLYLHGDYIASPLAHARDGGKPSGRRRKPSRGDGRWIGRPAVAGIWAR